MKSLEICVNLWLNILFFLILLPSRLSATMPTGFNHPELKWSVIETEHFKIIYHQGLEETAFESAQISESVYQPITQDLGAWPNRKIPIVLSDYEDLSNGIAEALGHFIFIWTQNDKKMTTGQMSWLQRVIAHEFAHQVTFYALRKFPGTIRELLSLGNMPMWFIEGVAEYESEPWDEHRDLFLQIATLDDGLLPSKKLGGFIGTDMFDSRLVYEQGHSLVRYIAAKYGKDEIRKIIQQYAKWPLSFNRALKKVLGLNQNELYKEWRREINLQYRRDYEQKEKLSEIGDTLHCPLPLVTGIRFSPDGKRMAVVGIEDLAEFVSRLYLMNPAHIHMCGVNIDGTKLKKIAEPEVGSFFSFSPDGKKIVYSKKHFGKFGSLIDDLYYFDLKTGKEKQLTHNLRATDPCWSPDGKWIAFSLYKLGVSAIALVDTAGNNLKILSPSNYGFEAFTPSWSSDSKRIVFSVIDTNSQRDIAIINSDETEYQKLTDDSFDDRFPVWSPDGAQVAFISYRSHRPNLYLIHPAPFLKRCPDNVEEKCGVKSDRREMTQITNVSGGIFNPTWQPFGRTPIQIGVDSAGSPVRATPKGVSSVIAISFHSWKETKICKIPSDRQITFQNTEPEDTYLWKVVQPYPIGNLKSQIPNPKSSISNLKSRISEYHSLLSIRELITIPWLWADERGGQIGLTSWLSDPLKKHNVLGFFAFGSPSRRIDFAFQYLNSQLPFNVSISSYGLSFYRGKYEGADFWERTSGASLSADFPLNWSNSPYIRDYLKVGCAFEKIKTLYLSQETVDLPTEGKIINLSIAYQYSSRRPDIAEDIDPRGGQFFSLKYEFAPRMGQDYLKYHQEVFDYKTYKRIPLFNHIFAFSLRGLIHQGDQPSQDQLSLGTLQSLRGLERTILGEKILVSRMEYRWLWKKDFGGSAGPLYLERINQALFCDFGNAWHKFPSSMKNISFISTVGSELRSRIFLFSNIPIISRIGWGIEAKTSAKGKWYFSIGNIF
ncbi:MAG: hypothetical protein AB1393_12495 [Candidatus Edwardsbacteria bacterium]